MNWIFGKSKIKKISTSELKNVYLPDKKENYFLDVRTRAEFSGQSIPGFINIPLQTLSEHLSKIPKDKELVVICQSGMRSTLACKLLTRAGYEHVINVRGGMNRWF
ncbi:rhodanese-like domain-containing protein [Sporolactobacillus sp. CPB3-1]|uniref:Rhodanese-like domain-containing protein n=1 Tax=Sporolactobacillus mangiferae TaxID=2940498 RepID=A0ABT0MAQ8_9BACL|nr:rhodanese-like domain-containing protein [Sporolactobacillus mangiferae]MCL1631947.1 rhodanese-like domain-containing protein [Sporolactobacillus mangiferae]